MMNPTNGNNRTDDANLQTSTDHNDWSDDLNPKAHPQGNAVKDPQDWVTKDEAMTGAQASYLKTLCEEAHREFSPDLTKAEASTMIDELQTATGRGKPTA